MQNIGERPRTFLGGKVVTAEAAVRTILNGDTLVTGGSIGIGFAEGLAIALEKKLFGVRPVIPGRQPRWPNPGLFWRTRRW